MSKQILILDDDADLRRDHVAKLKSLFNSQDVFTVREMTVDEFRKGLDRLEQRQAMARKRGPIDLELTCCFDQADVLVVESDLVPLRAGVTGEYVAYMARCFSRCGFILGVNQYGANSFDLTLTGHPESFADLNIGSDQLANSGLWTSNWPEFRPWQWPSVPAACTALEERTSELNGQLERTILEFLHITPEVSQLFPRQVIEFIVQARSLENFTGVTFKEFLVGSRHALQVKDAEGLLPEELYCRIAASRISKWLERLILSGQELLIDAPHLAHKFPSIVKNSELGIDSFNRIARIAPVSELELVHPEKLAPFEFKMKNWLSRPAWFFEQVRRCEDIAEIRDPWSRPPTDWEFCEDSSRFAPREQCSEFQAKTPSADTRRWVKRIDGVEYIPAVQFAL